MTKFVALLRGIAPSNPAMRNENLRRVVESLGHGDVRSVISSGNVLFESQRTDVSTIEEELEAAWPEMLGFTSSTIVRSREQLERLRESNPYGDLEHGPGSYLLVTFSKHALGIPFGLPYRPPGRPYEVLDVVDDTFFSVVDTTTGTTPDLMVWLEREFGKAITSRTWLTVKRLLAKM